MSLLRRATAGTKQERDENTTSKVSIIVVVTLAILIAVIVIAYIVLKHIRKRHPEPRYLPTARLKRAWREWSPLGFFPKGQYSNRLQDDTDTSAPTLHMRSNRPSTLSLPDAERGPTQERTVDRHTSVRSVMTLPAYSTAVGENERILGREGERDGIDIVVEAAETADEEEERREEEMESLYQIRVARRREMADREARRAERREARQRGDQAAIQRLREQSALRAQEGVESAAAMLAEHQSRSRERRVSSVSYADLGVARHDGTRIRANSNDSDRPLLDSAASIGGATLQPWNTNDTWTHHRNMSVGSVVSSEGEREGIPFGRSGADFEVVQLGNHSRDTSRAGESHSRSRSRTSSNLSIAAVPPADPPAYDTAGFEDAPPYSSPVEPRVPSAQQRPLSAQQERDSNRRDTSHRPSTSTSGAPVLPDIGRLPSIRIGEATPVDALEGREWRVERE